MSVKAVESNASLFLLSGGPLSGSAERMDVLVGGLLVAVGRK